MKYLFLVITISLLIIFSIIIIFLFLLTSKGRNPIKKNSLERELDSYDDVYQICLKSSDNLSKYIQTGDTSYVDFYTQEEAENPPEHIMAILKAFSDDTNEDEKLENVDLYLRHFSPLLLFYLVAVACIPGWIIWIFMCIYNCCCCCCCKKPKCRLPFFIIVSIMNLYVIITAIFGLGNTKSILNGVTNTKCAFLRFVNEILEGESKDILPKWAGIEEILYMLRETSLEIQKMSSDGIETSIEEKHNQYKNATNMFKNDLKSACDIINGEPKYKSNDNYILDLAKDFGKYIDEWNFTNNSYADKWIKEAELTDKIEKSYNTLGQILHGETYLAMIIAQMFIEYLETEVQKIRFIIGELLLIISDNLEKYGKIFFFTIFGVVLGFACLFEFLLVFLFFFSSSKYHNCFLHCSIKTLIHILWNIFVLIMILIFILGTTLAIIGTFGEDLIKFFLFIFCSKNLQSPSPIFLGEEAYLLEECMNRNGDVWKTMGIQPSLDNINTLKMLSLGIDLYVEIITIKAASDEDPVYDELIAEINKRKNSPKDYGLLVKENSDERLILKEIIPNMNQALSTCSISERWSFSCSQDFPGYSTGVDCTSNDNACFDPLVCYNELNGRYSSTCPEANTLGNYIYTIIDAINYGSSEDPVDESSLFNQAKNITESYDLFLTLARLSLDGFTQQYAPLTTLYNNFVGINGTIFGFLNCAFIGKNTKVLLYYLNDAFGTDLKNIGIVLIVMGFAMALSISFTILLVIIITATVKIREAEKKNMNVDKSPPIDKENNNDVNKDNNEKYSNEDNNDNANDNNFNDDNNSDDKNKIKITIYSSDKGKDSNEDKNKGIGKDINEENKEEINEKSDNSKDKNISLLKDIIEKNKKNISEKSENENEEIDEKNNKNKDINNNDDEDDDDKDNISENIINFKNFIHLGN